MSAKKMSTAKTPTFNVCVQVSLGDKSKLFRCGAVWPRIDKETKKELPGFSGHITDTLAGLQKRLTVLEISPSNVVPGGPSHQLVFSNRISDEETLYQDIGALWPSKNNAGLYGYIWNSFVGRRTRIALMPYGNSSTTDDGEDSESED